MLRERTFRAMGSDVHLVVPAAGAARRGGPAGDLSGDDAAVDPAALDRDAAAGAAPVAVVDAALDTAVDRLEQLEQRWSRFRPDSELCALNAGAGRVQAVSAETAAILELAVEAWDRTGGRFDPTVLGALLAAGYDRTFDELAPPSAEAGGTGARDGGAGGAAAVDPVEDRPLHGAGDVYVDVVAGTVLLPRGVQLDLGGIGKGHSADLLAGELLAAGCAGACVNLGGDVRVVGTGPDGGPWAVAVDDPFHPGDDLTVVVLTDGAVATSARTRRQWAGPTGTAHHLIDPSTGRPARRGLAAVTVVAGTAAWAEVYAKAAFLSGLEDGLALLADAGVEGLLVTDDGQVVRTPGFGAFEPAAAGSVATAGTAGTEGPEVGGSGGAEAPAGPVERSTS